MTVSERPASPLPGVYCLHEHNTRVPCKAVPAPPTARVPCKAVRASPARLSQHHGPIPGSRAGPAWCRGGTLRTCARSDKSDGYHRVSWRLQNPTGPFLAHLPPRAALWLITRTLVSCWFKPKERDSKTVLFLSGTELRVLEPSGQLTSRLRKAGLPPPACPQLVPLAVLRVHSSFPFLRTGPTNYSHCFLSRPIGWHSVT